MNFTKHILLLLFLVSLTSFSQTPETDANKLSLNSGTLIDQFEYITTKSNGWNDAAGQPHKVIKVSWLTDLKAHVLDSIQVAQKNLRTSTNTIKAQTEEINDLKNKLSTAQQTLTDAKDRKDSMSFFGFHIKNNIYNMIVWSAIAILLALLILFIYKYKNSHVVTNNAKVALLELESEFDDHRKTALDREQKVRRQLIDEINKQRTNK